MSYRQTIEQLVAEKRFDEAFALLDEKIALNENDDEALYLRGKLHWRRGEMRLALNDFSSAVALNPESPARLSIEQANAILDFYNRDLYNP